MSCHVSLVVVLCFCYLQHIKRTDTNAELLLPQELPLCGDVKVEFFHQSRFGGKVCLLVCLCLCVLWGLILTGEDVCVLV